MGIENLEPNDTVEAFPCPVCGSFLPIRDDKRGKPYVFCPKCMAQFFVRGRDGIREFNKKTVRKKAKETLF